MHGITNLRSEAAPVAQTWSRYADSFDDEPSVDDGAPDPIGWVEELAEPGLHRRTGPVSDQSWLRNASWRPSSPRGDSIASGISHVVRERVYGEVNRAVEAVHLQSQDPVRDAESKRDGEVSRAVAAVHLPDGESHTAAGHSSSIVVITTPGKAQVEQLVSDLRTRTTPTTVVSLTADRKHSVSMLREMGMQGVKKAWGIADRSWMAAHPYHPVTLASRGIRGVGSFLHTCGSWVLRSRLPGSPVSIGTVMAYLWERLWGPMTKVKIGFTPFVPEFTRPGAKDRITAAGQETWQRMVDRACETAKGRGGDVVFVIRNAHRMDREELHQVCTVVANARGKKLPVVLVLWGDESLDQLLGSVDVGERRAAHITRLLHLNRAEFDHELYQSRAVVPGDDPGADRDLNNIAQAAYDATAMHMRNGSQVPLYRHAIAQQRHYLWGDDQIYTEPELLDLLAQRRLELSAAGDCPPDRLFNAKVRGDGAIVFSWPGQLHGTADIIPPLHIEAHRDEATENVEYRLSVGGERSFNSEMRQFEYQGSRCIPGITIDGNGALVRRGRLEGVKAVVENMRTIRAAAGGRPLTAEQWRAQLPSTAPTGMEPPKATERGTRGAPLPYVVNGDGVPLPLTARESVVVA